MAIIDFLVVESEAEYREKMAEYLTAHQLADFRRCPFLFDQKRRGVVVDEDPPADVVSRAAHVMIMEEQDRFYDEYAVGQSTPSADQTVITNEQFTLVVCLKIGVRSHAVANKLLSDGMAKGVVRTDYRNRPCQARIDFYNRECGIIELKVCDDLTWFEADARRHGYVYDVAFSRSVLAAAAKVEPREIPVHLIGVEKKPPYRCGVWQMSEQVLVAAQQENIAAMARIVECELRNSWPTGYEDVRIFDHV